MHLGGGKADPTVLVHRFNHVIDQLLEIVRRDLVML
jgi:hypothetical protein